MGLLNLGGPIAQSQRNRCSISPVEVIFAGGVRSQENGLSEKTYYYWQRRLFQTLSEQQQAIRQPAFAEITPTPNVRPSSGVAVTIRISGVEAEIYNGADVATVETVLRILKSC